VIDTAIDTIMSVRGGAFEIETMPATAHEIANRKIKTTPNATDHASGSGTKGRHTTIEQTAVTRALHRKAPRLVVVLLCLSVDHATACVDNA
jgi:hypothetical protein